MVQISIEGTSILFTIRITTYEALLQEIVRQVKTNRILPIFYFDRTKNVYVQLQSDDVEPLRRKTHMKLRLTGKDPVLYEGQLNEEGKKHGHGMYRWPNGRTYVGDWVNNLMEGEGVESWPNGSRYQGQFRANRRHGHGTFTWADGRQYIGEYQNDLRHGFGVCTFPNGYRYEGEWIQGKKHGRGFEVFPDGHRFSGKFENDQAVQPSTEDSLMLFDDK